jgi:beta-lactamase superfamily II metal-dependent hydrolase
MRRMLSILVLALALGLQSITWAQPSGTLQIHFMDVGQGDGAILIAPDGQTVLFDNGVFGQCNKPLTYLNTLGITKIDYQIISHYHADHLGCTKQVLAAFPLQRFSLDRGGSYHGNPYDAYVTAVGAKRQTATEGQTLTLNQGPGTPVVIRIVTLNGNGVTTDNENDESVVALVSYGNFRAEIGGDLSGFDENSYADIETSTAPKVGQVDVYKVHHHGSRYSTNSAWLQTINPRVGIISTGNGNTHGHPTEECVERLHNAGVKMYWTEAGNGALPEDGVDTIGGTIIVDVPAAANTYTVRHTAGVQTTTQFNTWLSGGGTPHHPPISPVASFAWSKNSNLYHAATCRFVSTISAGNLQTGATPPLGKTLHKDCPK